MFAPLLLMMALSGSPISASAASPALVREASAVVCGDKCEDDCFAIGCTHRFAGGGAYFQCGLDGCHSNWRQDGCAAHHQTCSGTTFLENERTYQLVDEAVRHGDWAWLATLRRGNDQVVLNTERSAIQVTNCAGQVIASFTVSAPILEQVAGE